MLFTSKKKHSTQASSTQAAVDVAQGIENISMKVDYPAKSKTQTGRQGLTTGSCMTCGSLVRWPIDLTVFRCTICLTVNDLRPAVLDLTKSAPRFHMLKDGTFAAKDDDGIGPISVSHTKKLINMCLRRHLISSIPGSKTAGAGERVTAPRSPLDEVMGHDASAEHHPTPSIVPSHGTTSGAAPSARSRPAALGRGPPDALEHATPSTQPKEASKIFEFLEEDILFHFVSADILNLSFRRRSSSPEHSGTSSREPSVQMDWGELHEWYRTVINAGQPWWEVFTELQNLNGCRKPSPRELQQIETEILVAQEHLQRFLLKATENLLKRPRRPIDSPKDMQFFLTLLSNPLLPGSCETFKGRLTRHPLPGQRPRPSEFGNGPASGQHSGIIKRILGLISNSPDECHRHLVHVFSRVPEPRFAQFKDLVSGFLAHRLRRQRDKAQKDEKMDITGGLVPTMPVDASAATLHAALGATRRASSKAAKTQPALRTYREDWQIKAAARVLALLYTANKAARHSKADLGPLPPSEYRSSLVRDYALSWQQFLPISDFYTVLLDDSDIIADYEAWELHKGKGFSFCQYPFLLSIWAKIQILEHDARRQMRNKARDAFFDSIMTHRNVEQYLTLNIRRDCLVEDSLKAVSEATGSGGEEIKKGLRIVFKGEEGIDGGGLREEWFLLLVREVFNPDHGMFVYDDESQYCYFNPYSLETSDQFFLVGVVLGLAIYNSTILDIAFPPFAFRKLLANIPGTPSTPSTLPPRPSSKLTLSDLAEYRPSLARGLHQLLTYPDPDIESTFCLSFAITVDRLGRIETNPLCPGGASRPITNDNRREYVDLYIRYLLDTSVSRQFEPFRRGFFAVCGGSNALSLFAPEEIELLVRGSDEALDVASLRGAAAYDGFRKSGKSETDEPTVNWFWETFEEASPADQRKLLMFITGSDRIPATGPASLSVRLVCLGEDEGRYPTARTCFNGIYMARYKTKERLVRMLWGAVHESEGFGLK